MQLPLETSSELLRRRIHGLGCLGLIAEVKKGSPTRGIFREDFDPVEIARAYEKGGAACLSVLTDEKYFKGSFENLEAIRSAGVKCPLLCKEFVIDAWQIYYARIKGADGIRLIAAVLPDLDIRYMVKICKMLGSAALVEVHDEREMDRVLGIEGIELIGINNRNLVGDQIPEKGRGGRCVESEGMGSWKVPKRSRCESRHKNKAKTAYGSAVALFRLQNEGNTPRNILEEIIWQYKLIQQFCLEIKSVIKVRLPSMDEKVALVPWADMLNHSCEVETFLDYDRSSHGVVFTTDRAYQPGEQVFISYGKKSNGELLLSYGFVPKEGTNPSDSVELSLSLKKSDKCYKEKLEALRKHGLSA
ncbi:hypothetical protein QUC31_004175 [Theobroma cacao]